MVRAGVIGHPIKHSLSPVIFDFLSKKMKMSLEYFAADIPPANLKEEFLKLKKNCVGLNVTIPHKEAILQYSDEVISEAKALGAANVVHFLNERCIAHNTDIFGILETWKQHQINIKGQDVVIIGGGGAARAAAFAAGISGAKKTYIVSRKTSQSTKIVSQFQSRFTGTSFISQNISDKIAAPWCLVVNATPLGMAGFSDEPETFFSPIFDLISTKKGVAFDLIYRPKETPFLAMAGEQKFMCVGGLDMLVHQALGTWKIWFPQKPLPDTVFAEVTGHLSTHHI